MRPLDSAVRGCLMAACSVRPLQQTVCHAEGLRGVLVLQIEKELNEWVEQQVVKHEDTK